MTAFVGTLTVRLDLCVVALAQHQQVGRGVDPGVTAASHAPRPPVVYLFSLATTDLAHAAAAVEHQLCLFLRRARAHLRLDAFLRADISVLASEQGMHRQPRFRYVEADP
jgi:hypothetical protein